MLSCPAMNVRATGYVLETSTSRPLRDDTKGESRGWRPDTRRTPYTLLSSSPPRPILSASGQFQNPSARRLRSVPTGNNMWRNVRAA
jgi:hypothetical protein